MRMALGTDAGSWLNTHDDIVTELRLRVEVGVPPLAALTMATGWSAERPQAVFKGGALVPSAAGAVSGGAP